MNDELEFKVGEDESPATVSIGEDGAAEVGAARAQCHRFEHILARAYAAVHVHLDLVADRSDDRRQRADAGLGAVELAPAMVADDQRVGA